MSTTTAPKGIEDVELIRYLTLIGAAADQSRQCWARWGFVSQQIQAGDQKLVVAAGSIAGKINAGERVNVPSGNEQLVQEAGMLRQLASTGLSDMFKAVNQLNAYLEAATKTEKAPEAKREPVLATG